MHLYKYEFVFDEKRWAEDDKLFNFSKSDVTFEQATTTIEKYPKLSQGMFDYKIKRITDIESNKVIYDIESGIKN